MGKKKNANRVSVAVTEKVTRLMKIENGKKKMVWAVNDGEGAGYREVAPPAWARRRKSDLKSNGR